MISRHDADLAGRDDRFPRPAAGVARRQATLVARWMNLGFIHGVMNTDNMTLSGRTIDYGPCAFMEAFDPGRCSAASTTAVALRLAVNQPC